MTYPATTFSEAVVLAIQTSNQMHDVINGTATEEIPTDGGNIPSLRKALTDNFYFVSPIDWDVGADETVFNQLRTFTDGSVWWAPTATVSNPVEMTADPYTDSNWTLSIVGNKNYIINEVNSGDSQLAGGAIWPLSSQDSAQVGDDLTGYENIRLTGGSFTSISLFRIVKSDGSGELPSGSLNSFDITNAPWSCDIGGDVFYLSDYNYNKKEPRSFGAAGDLVTDDTAVFSALESIFDSYMVADGDFLISNITLTKTLMFIEGGKIASRSADVLIEGLIEAGDWVIFDSDIDYYVNLPSSFHQDPQIKIKGQNRVLVDWFGNCKVLDKNLIKSVPNAANFITQAFRACTGAYIPDTDRPGDFIGEFVDNNVGLSTGYYNIESMVRWSIFDSGANYRTSGNGLIGNGVSTSYLVASELKFGDGEPIIQISRFTGQINTFRDFKVEVFAPQEGANRFLGEHGAALWFSSGDSLQINNVWAAGCQVGVDDGDGFLRNGAGIQFASVIDVQGSNVFSENNLYNYAVYSSVVAIANCVSFGSKEAACIFGIPAENFSYPQGQQNCQFNVTGADWHNCRNEGILAVEQGANIKLTGFRATGTGESGGPAQGRDFIRAINDSFIQGSISGATIIDFVSSLARAIDSANLGTVRNNLSISNGTMTGITTTQTTNNPGLITTGQSSSTSNTVRLSNFSFDVCRPQIFDFTGKIVVENVNLSEFRGQSDSGVDRQLFQLRGGSARLINITRADQNSQQIAQYGFINSGNAYIDILASDLEGVTRSVAGAGTATMPDIIPFV